MNYTAMIGRLVQAWHALEPGRTVFVAELPQNCDTPGREVRVAVRTQRAPAAVRYADNVWYSTATFHVTEAICYLARVTHVDHKTPVLYRYP